MDAVDSRNRDIDESTTPGMVEQISECQMGVEDVFEDLIAKGEGEAEGHLVVPRFVQVESRRSIERQYGHSLRANEAEVPLE